MMMMTTTATATTETTTTATISPSTVTWSDRKRLPSPNIVGKRTIDSSYSFLRFHLMLLLLGIVVTCAWSFHIIPNTRTNSLELDCNSFYRTTRTKQNPSAPSPASPLCALRGIHPISSSSQNHRQSKSLSHHSILNSVRNNSPTFLFQRVLRPQHPVDFHLSSHPPPPLPTPPSRLGILVWSYPPNFSSPEEEREESWVDDTTNHKDDDDQQLQELPAQQSVGYDGLYEFLTRRTGEQAGESERLRKRDRIMEWMKSSSRSSSSATSAATHMVQPIRVRDGKVDESLMDNLPPAAVARTKAKFDQLFSGMPTLDQILSRKDGDDENQDSSTVALSHQGDHDNDDDATTPRSRLLKNSLFDFSWFETEKKLIEQEYEQIRDEIKETIRQQRLDDPEGIPDNAEGIVESIVMQEMERMINSVRIARAKERLEEDERIRMSNLDATDFSGATDAVVEKILKEAADQWELQDKLRQQADQFSQYESQRKAAQQHEELSSSSSSVTPSTDTSISRDDTDWDDWALERLEEMLEASQSRQDDDGSVSDILEENIKELRKRMEKESKKGSIQPSTMKEWQMYRAIATRLQQARSGENSSSGSDTIVNEDNVDEALIAQRLNSWREYVQKENGIRRQSGLASGPKLPFDDLGEKADQILERNQNLTPEYEDQKKTRRELRREVNMQAVQAMESLLQKSDNMRAEGLKKELEALKAELEPRDYNDTEEEITEAYRPEGPVDLSDVFYRSQTEELDKEDVAVSSFSKDELAGINRVLSNTGVDDLYKPAKPSSPPDTLFSSETHGSIEGRRPPPPIMPFFEDYYEAERKPLRPNTPFFEDNNSKGRADRDELDIDNKLGSADEQKLQAMFRRAGARTKAEQDKIRKDWESFQQLEKQRRDQLGLSDNSDDASYHDTNLKYDISDVMTKDGDFDADKILSTIGPRPTRKPISASQYVTGDSEESNEGADTKLKSNVGPADVADSLFRSVAAAGGGRVKEDDNLQKKQRSEFDEYLQKQEEMRARLDRLDENAAEIAKNSNVSPDDPEYAQEVLSAIGSRPKFRRRRTETIDERKLSDMGGVRSSYDSEDISSSTSSTDSEDVSSMDTPRLDDIVPAWLKKEREAAAKSREDSDEVIMGSDIDDVFDDDTYERNFRQLHEYEQRRSGRKQMGIDVSDVFGRRGSDDYSDYTYDTDYFRYRQDGWGEASFRARKENLLQYIELDPAEVNSVMTMKESVYATGVSQYLPRINKPFKEFGSIFRLEGVLVDIQGLQEKVWKRVAAEFKFKEPLDEDIQRAAVSRPDVVIREVLFNLNDFILERKVIDAYRRMLREEFDSWMIAEGIFVKDRDVVAKQGVDNKGSLAIGFEDPKPLQKVNPLTIGIEDERERLKYLKERWTKTARQFGFSPPTNEQIAESFILTPDIAVRNIFGWSRDEMQIDQIVAAYSIIQAGEGAPIAEQRADFGIYSNVADNKPREQIESKELSEGEVLELQYKAWIKVAADNALDEPDPEEVLAASVLNDPEAVIMAGYGWTEDPGRASQLATQYRERLTELLDIPPSPARPNVSSPLPPSTELQEITPSGPTEKEILFIQIEAWKDTAKEFHFEVPSTDRIQWVINANPASAVSQLLLMDYDVDDDVLEEITDYYKDALHRSSKQYLQQHDIIFSKTETETALNSSPTNQSKYVSSDEIYQAAYDAWTSIAWKNGYSMPNQEQVQFAMSVGPEDAILSGFCWTDSPKEAESIAKQYLDQIKTRREGWIKRGYLTSVSMDTNVVNTDKEDIPPVRVLPGVVNWIQSLREVEMACGVVSHLEKDQMDILLEYAGLADLFPEDVRVSYTNGYQRDSQQLLGAALRMERRPDHCVAFDTSPYASLAAHDVDMRSVSLVGPYPRYELLSADTTSSSVDELTAMNIRRLFGERVYDQPELDMKIRQPETNKRVKTAYDWDDG